MTFEAPGDGNLNIRSKLDAVSTIDKAKILAGCMRVLEIDISDDLEVAIYVAMGQAVEKKAHITKVETFAASEGKEAPMSTSAEAVRDFVVFSALIVGMIGIPGLIWLYADWKHRWGWFFPKK